MTHTMTELMGLSNEKLKLVIATLKDFSIIQLNGHNEYLKQNTQTGNWVRLPIPDWPTDIRAAYELEESIPEELREKYAEILTCLIFLEASAVSQRFRLIHAPARIRCIAYILTMEEKE